MRTPLLYSQMTKPECGVVGWEHDCGRHVDEPVLRVARVARVWVGVFAGLIIRNQLLYGDLTQARTSTKFWQSFVPFESRQNNDLQSAWPHLL